MSISGKGSRKLATTASLPTNRKKAIPFNKCGDVVGMKSNRSADFYVPDFPGGNTLLQGSLADSKSGGGFFCIQ
jgi:hypothetical protein